MSVERECLRALVVDDDSIAVRMTSFALEQEGFICDRALDGEKALDFLDRHEYDLLVTDLRMPNKHGHALAVDVLARAPHPSVIVHTSVEDPKLTKDLMIRGVDDVVYKPTNYATFAAKAKGMVVRKKEEQERQTLLESPAVRGGDCADADDEAEADIRTPVGADELNARLADVAKVQPVSHVALDVSKMVRSNSFDAEHVASAVQRDPALAEKVLQLANNPFYNPNCEHIGDVKRAVTRIGQKRVGEFALALSSFASITPATLPWMDLDLAWRRSVAAGLAMELLIKQGRHFKVCEGLLFSALMHSSGRTVLGTHYPKRYQAMVKSCTDNAEALQIHELQAFRDNHTQVMCKVLTDWGVPAEVFAPLRHILKDYAALSRVPEPDRTKAELVKLAVLLGQVAVGQWEVWDLIEFAPQQLLNRLAIDDIGRVLEQIKTQLAGVANFRADSESHARQLNSDSRPVAYCNLSTERFDFLGEIVRSMGIKLNAVDHNRGKLRGRFLVNRIGAIPEQSITKCFQGCGEVVFVRDAEKLRLVKGGGTHIALPCSYAALRSACWKAVGAS